MRIWVLIVALFCVVSAEARAEQMLELDAAVRANDISQVSQLIDNGADPNTIFNQGRNAVWAHAPIILAAKAQNLSMIELLISKGADVNYVNGGSNTALKEAVNKNNLEMVTVLIAAGANVGFVDENPASILFWAVSAHSDRVIPLLLDAGADPDRELDLMMEGISTVRKYFSTRGNQYAKTLQLLK